MLLLANPSYLTVAQFRAQANDQDLSSYTDAQIQDMLNRASGNADSIMRRSLLARERTIRYTGDGSNKLELREWPLLYIKRLQLVVPGSTGSLIPPNQLLIDSEGSVINYTPVYLMQGLGYYAMFPAGVPIDVTMGWGFGYTAASAPNWSASDASGSGLTPGTYNVAVTAKTMWGETVATVRQYTTATGSFLVNPANVLGSYVFRCYISSAANNTTLSANVAAGATSCAVTSPGLIAAGDVLLITNEYVTVKAINGSTLTTTAFANAHTSGETVMEQPKLSTESPLTSYGSTGLQFTVSSLTPVNGMWQDVLPLTDTSAPPIPQAITEAVRLLTLSIIWEQNNLANRGVYMQDSDNKRISWRSTQGNSGRGVPITWEQATSLLKPYSLQSIF